MRLYIDPGTGSMLFTILIGIFYAAFYAFRGLIIKIKFYLSGGKVKADLDRHSYVIYSDDKRYWNIFEPICQEFEARGIPIVYLTASEDDPAFKQNFKNVVCHFIGEGNRGFIRLNMLKADILLSSTPGLDVYQWKRSPDVKYYIHILHSPSDAIYRMFGLDYFDCVMLSGVHQEKQIRELEKVRGLPSKDLPIVGQPYLDGLLKRVKESSSKSQEHITTVLVAPSWGKSSILNKYGSSIIDALLATGYQIIIRPHPQSWTSEKSLIDKLIEKYPNSDQLSWNQDNDNFEVLKKSDIMISDFSGVIFDFVLAFDKPIIYADTSYDPSPYDSWWLKDGLWTFSILPKLGTQLTGSNLKNIKDIIDSCMLDTKYQKSREEIRKEAWEHIGNSAKLVVDYLIDKHSKLMTDKEEIVQ